MPITDEIRSSGRCPGLSLAVLYVPPSNMARVQQSLCRSIWVNFEDLCLFVYVLAQLVGLLLLIATSIVWLPLLALSLLLLSILLALPFLFVLYAVPWLYHFFRRGSEPNVNAEFLTQLPPEILQEIFGHCCDREYIDFFHHFSLEPKGETRCNMAYTLKSVCKGWKLLAETTPTLWQKIQFGTFPDTGFEQPDFKGEEVFRSLRHCTNMMEQVLLPRSGQLPIQIQITRRCNAFHVRHPGSPCSHAEYTLPLLKLLSSQSHRFTCLNLDGFGHEERVVKTPPAVVADLIRVLSSMDFRHLEVLTLDGGEPLGHPAIDLFQQAPRLAKLVLTGTEPWMRGRGGIMENLTIRWSKITTLELDLSHPTNGGPAASVSEVARVLQAVRHSLTHLSWTGWWNCRDSYFEEMRLTEEISKLPEIFDGPYLVLSSLRSLTLADKDNHFTFSTTFLPKIMCPELEVLRVLLCTEDQHYGYKMREKSLAKSPPMDGLRHLLYKSPKLRQVTILHAGTDSDKFRLKLVDNCIGESMFGIMTFGYLIFQGTRGSLQSQVADRLTHDAGFSSRLSLLSLSKHSPKLTKRLLRRIMGLVPWYTYASDIERRQQKARDLMDDSKRHPIRPVAKTSRERSYGTDQGLVFHRMFNFVEDIAPTADPKYGHLPLVDQVFWDSMSSKDLNVLTSILDLIRCREPSASSTYLRDSLPDTCIFTIAVPRGRFMYGQCIPFLLE